MADDEAADLFGQRIDPLLQGVALVGESQLRALRPAGLGYAPGN